MSLWNSTFAEMFSASPFGFTAVVVIIAVVVVIVVKRRKSGKDDVTSGNSGAASYASSNKPHGKKTGPAQSLVTIKDADDKTTAAIIAIIAEETKSSLDSIRVSLIRKINVKPDGLGKDRYNFEIGEESSGIMKYRVTLDDSVYEVAVEGGEAAVKAQTPAAAAPASDSTDASGAVKDIKAPLTGVILDISVNSGDSVKTGQLLLILEALKMENEIIAPYDAIVSKIHVHKGDSVNTGDTMLTLI